MHSIPDKVLKPTTGTLRNNWIEWRTNLHFHKKGELGRRAPEQLHHEAGVRGREGAHRFRTPDRPQTLVVLQLVAKQWHCP